MGALAFLAHDWLLVIPAVLAAAAFGYIAFILKNWRAALAAGAIVVALFGAGVLYKRGYDARTAELITAQRKIFEARIKTVDDAREADAKRAEDDAESIRILQKQIDDTPVNNAPGLSRDAARRIGKIK